MPLLLPAAGPRGKSSQLPLGAGGTDRKIDRTLEKGTGTFATGIAAVWVSSYLAPAGVHWRRAAHGSFLERPVTRGPNSTVLFPRNHDWDPNPLAPRRESPKKRCSAGQQRHATPTHTPQTVATNVPVPFAWSVNARCPRRRLRWASTSSPRCSRQSRGRCASCRARPSCR